MPAILSAAAGNAYSVRVRANHAEPNVARYVLVSLPSGERKTAMLHWLARPLVDWAEEMRPEYERDFTRVRGHNDNIEDRVKVLRKKAAGEADRHGWMGGSVFTTKRV